MTGDPPGQGRRRRRPRKRAWGIRTRVLAIALIPSAALFLTGVSVIRYLIAEGISARDFAWGISE